jgi:enamine deaminase RidA (YjgF/YER057c/UK114 family)
MSRTASAISELGYSLPPAPKPAGSYVPCVQSGKILFIAGQVSRDCHGELIKGKLGSELNIEQGKEAARAAVLNALSIIESGPGLDSVSRVLRVSGFVQSAPDFYSIPDVVNGASDLLLAVFGETGRHARCSVGVASLPMNAAVEIEMTVELK